MSHVELSTQLSEDLLQWYKQQARSLPWRRDKDPYKVWVSEMMLQQTRVDTVIPYFENFITKFPTLQSLSEASEEEVIKAWEGLGYYSRIRRLHSSVKEVVAVYGGEVPREVSTFSGLQGVGPYTTGAVLSIAYDLKVPAVDGNVMRVFSRLFLIWDDIAKQATRKKMEAVAIQLIPDDHAGDFNQALMELGALICTPTSPQCLLCPVQIHCSAYQTGQEHVLPVKTKAKAALKMDVLFLWLSSGADVLLAKRAEKGLLANMWSLPTIEMETGQTIDDVFDLFCDQHALEKPARYAVDGFKHIFSHRHWNVHLLKVPFISQNLAIPRHEWTSIDQLDELAFPNVYQKAIHKLIGD